MIEFNILGPLEHYTTYTHTLQPHLPADDGLVIIPGPLPGQRGPEEGVVTEKSPAVPW